MHLRNPEMHFSRDSEEWHDKAIIKTKEFLSSIDPKLGVQKVFKRFTKNESEASLPPRWFLRFSTPKSNSGVDWTEEIDEGHDFFTSNKNREIDWIMDIEDRDDKYLESEFQAAVQGIYDQQKLALGKPRGEKVSKKANTVQTVKEADMPEEGRRRVA